VPRLAQSELGNRFELQIFERRVHAWCDDFEIARLLEHNFGRLRSPDSGDPSADLDYSLRRHADGFVLERSHGEPLCAAEAGELLYLLEKDVTVELQKLRRDLYFLHAAALAWRQEAFLVVGASGAGKSTLTWALSHHGFRYLSDELAPIDLDRLDVHAYPHALCLKAVPAEPYALPASTLETAWTLHVPASDLPGGVGDTSRLAAIFFLQSDFSTPAEPGLRPISAAEAGARLLANALNPLAHATDGLDPAIAIARRVHRFELRPGNLERTCALVARMLADVS
jgi:hypothetical protein